MRTTKKDLEAITEQMSKATGRHYFISYAYGKARLVMADGGGVRDISPRMSRGEVFSWADAWLKGFYAALATMEERGVNLKIFLQAKGELCPKCGSADVSKQGEKPGSIGWTCAACGYLFETFTG